MDVREERIDADRERHELRMGFDRAAEDYQRTRPVCPPQLFDDLVDRAGLRPGDRVIEIGCGTGQATVPLAERGLAVTAVELGANLAAVARRRLAGFPSAQVLVSSFEDWQDEGTPAQAVVAVNSLHWIADLRYAKPHRLLRPDGFMAVVSCHWARPADADGFWRDVQEDYRAVGFEGEPHPRPEKIGPANLPAGARPLFEEVAKMRYPFQMPLRAEDYSPTSRPSPDRPFSAPRRGRSSSPGWSAGCDRWDGPR